jgi:hypothetical protein
VAREKTAVDAEVKKEAAKKKKDDQ